MSTETNTNNKELKTERSRSQSQQVPALRFREFDCDYRTQKLSEVFSIFNGYAFSSNDSQESGCRWVKIADVGINEMKLDSPSFLPNEYKEKHSKFILNEGDYVIALTRPVLNGELKIAKINIAFDGSLLNQRVGKLTSKNDLRFIYCMLQQNSLISRIENRIAGTDPPNLSPYEIATLKTYIPSLPEQQKIASFLTAVDKKIQQLTRKKELLEQYKKGVMQKLFSQELRFKDKNGNSYPDWENMKLENILTFISTNSFTRNDLNYDKGEVLNIHYGDIHTRFNSSFDVNKEKVPYVNSDILKNQIPEEQFCRIGDIVIADASEDYNDIGKTIEMHNIGNHRILAGLHTFLGRDKKSLAVNGYKGFLFQSWNLRLQIMKIAQGISVLGVSKKNLSKLAIQLPSKKEQQKIVNYISAIDTKIESINNQITQTKTFKKGLLQQMFV